MPVVFTFITRLWFQVSTYALLVEDVLEVIADTVVVQEAAASRIQRLTKVSYLSLSVSIKKYLFANFSDLDQWWSSKVALVISNVCTGTHVDMHAYLAQFNSAIPPLCTRFLYMHLVKLNLDPAIITKKLVLRQTSNFSCVWFTSIQLFYCRSSVVFGWLNLGMHT